MKKDWTNLSATLNQLTKVQPNIIEFWRFQAGIWRITAPPNSTTIANATVG